MKKLHPMLSILGLLALLAGAAFLAGCAGEHADQANHAATESAATDAVPASGEVVIEVTDAGFVPAVVTVAKGEPVTLVVTRKTDQTCATEMVFAGSGEKHDLPLNETVRIELPADRAETLDYACAMNMIKGQVVTK